MKLVDPPVRREVAVRTVPKISVANHTMFIDVEGVVMRMPLDVASGMSSRMTELFQALSKLQS